MSQTTTQRDAQTERTIESLRQSIRWGYEELAKITDANSPQYRDRLKNIEDLEWRLSQLSE
jgi:hypothetical protein